MMPDALHRQVAFDATGVKCEKDLGERLVHPAAIGWAQLKDDGIGMSVLRAAV